MAKISKMVRNGQVTVPKKIRDSLHLKEGDMFEVEQTAEGILFRPVQTQYRKVTMPELIKAMDKDIASGKYEVVDVESIEGLIDDL